MKIKTQEELDNGKYFLIHPLLAKTDKWSLYALINTAEVKNNIAAVNVCGTIKKIPVNEITDDLIFKSIDSFNYEYECSLWLKNNPQYMGFPFEYNSKLTLEETIIVSRSFFNEKDGFKMLLKVVGKKIQYNIAYI